MISYKNVSSSIEVASEFFFAKFCYDGIPLINLCTSLKSIQGMISYKNVSSSIEVASEFSLPNFAMMVFLS